METIRLDELNPGGGNKHLYQKLQELYQMCDEILEEVGEDQYDEEEHSLYLMGLVNDITSGAGDMTNAIERFMAEQKRKITVPKEGDFLYRIAEPGKPYREGTAEQFCGVVVSVSRMDRAIHVLYRVCETNGDCTGEPIQVSMGSGLYRVTSREELEETLRRYTAAQEALGVLQGLRKVEAQNTAAAEENEEES